MESAARDKKQKNNSRYRHFEQASDDEQEAAKANAKEIIWADIERRSGEDRRQQQADRGRWLESRHSKDRRKQNQYCFKI